MSHNSMTDPYKIVRSKPWWLGLVTGVVLRGPSFESGAVITLGSTIYSRDEIGPGVLAHELTHVRQQSPGTWKAIRHIVRYSLSRKFRLAMEAEAYREQFRRMQDFVKDRNDLARIQSILAEELSGPLYKHLVSKEEALRILRQ